MNHSEISFKNTQFLNNSRSKFFSFTKEWKKLILTHSIAKITSKKFLMIIFILKSTVSDIKKIVTKKKVSNLEKLNRQKWSIQQGYISPKR